MEMENCEHCWVPIEQGFQTCKHCGAVLEILYDFSSLAGQAASPEHWVDMEKYRVKKSADVR